MSQRRLLSYLRHQIQHAIGVQIDLNIPLIAPACVEQVNGDVASIAAQHADVLEVRLDQTLHDRIFGGGLRRLRGKILDGVARQQIQKVFVLHAKLQRFLHGQGIQIVVLAELSDLTARDLRRIVMNRRFAFQHGRIQQILSNLEIGELIAAVILPTQSIIAVRTTNSPIIFSYSTFRS